MSSQLQDKENVAEIHGKSRFFNPFTGKDPFEEDIKKGLSLEEMRKRLQERSAQEKIRYLESLLSKRGGSLKKGTVHGIEEIITESYRFFGDEMMDKGHYGKAAQSYGNANEDELAKKAWKMEGDAQMAAAQAQSIPGGEENSGEESHNDLKPAEAKHEEFKHGESRPEKSGPGSAESPEAGAEAKKGEPGKEKTEKPKKKPGKETEHEEKMASAEPKPEERKEGGKPGKSHSAGKKRKSGFASAAEAYENAGETEMASAAWKMAGDEYLSLSEKGDRGYLDDALDSYKRGNQFRMAVYVSLLSGKSAKSVEDLAKKGSLGKKELVLMAKDFLVKEYFHAARILFNLAGEKDLANKISDMEKKKNK